MHQCGSIGAERAPKFFRGFVGRVLPLLLEDAERRGLRVVTVEAYATVYSTTSVYSPSAAAFVAAGPDGPGVYVAAMAFDTAEVAALVIAQCERVTGEPPRFLRVYDLAFAST